MATGVKPSAISAASVAAFKTKLDIFTKEQASSHIATIGGAQSLRIETHAAVGSSSPGTGNTFVGYRAGIVNYANTVSAHNNTFIGGQSGQANTNGYQNTFVGSSCGSKNETGYANTFIGQGAGYANVLSFGSVHVGFHSGLNVLGAGSSDETGNVFIGYETGTGAAGSTAIANVLVGSQIGKYITSAARNVILGRNAAYALTSGTDNSVFGYGAGFSLDTGVDNVMIGHFAGYTATGANATTTGTNNVFIGTESGASSATQLTNAIAIGYRAVVLASNTAVIGNVSVTDVYLGSLTGAANLKCNAVTSNGGLQTFGANDSGGIGYRMVVVPNI